jgi:class 3 adenylate cyclase
VKQSSSQGLSGQIQVSQTTYEKLKNHYLFEERGMILFKGKGEMQTYWLTGKNRGALLSKGNRDK